MIVPYHILISGQLVCTIIIFCLSLCVCAIWEELLKDETIKNMFTDRSATFDLLNIVVGFSYVKMTRDFIDVMLSYTHLYSQIKLRVLTLNPSMETVRRLFEVSEIDEQWKDLRDKYWIMMNDESGMIFNVFGPYLALLIYFVVHPPLVRNESFWEWAIVYSVSVAILFAFILNLWFLERSVIPNQLKRKSLALAAQPMRMGSLREDAALSARRMWRTHPARSARSARADRNVRFVP